MKTTMYPGNPYIENAEELESYNLPRGDSMDMYDNKHGLAHNDLLRAQYRHWLSILNGMPEIMTRADRELLDINEACDAD